MIKTIAFDADDTLWTNEHLYLQYKDRFQQILAAYAAPAQSIALLDKKEVENIRWYGYGIKSFVLSMLETAIEITGGTVSPADLSRIITIARTMFSHEVELYEDTRQTLETLHKHYPLILITKGDTWEQHHKIHRAGIEHCFRAIEIVPEKNTETYRRLLEKHRIDPATFLMVGNSLRSDILPVVEIGGSAVYIPRGSTWAHEHVPAEQRRHIRYTELETLADLPAHLAAITHG